MTAKQAREKVIEQHTVQKTISNILSRIERGVETYKYHFEENNDKFYIEVDYDYSLDNIIENRTEQVVRELNILGYAVDTEFAPGRMYIYW